MRIDGVEKETKSRILKIGITGSAGSGKSLVRRAFSRLGVKTLDCDRIARDVVAPGEEGYDGVVEIFGPGVIRADSSLDRARLRNLMVERPVLRKKLEALLHPLITSELFRRIKTGEYGRERACACEVPLLFELGMEKAFHAAVVVTADDAVLAERIAARDGVSLSAAHKMLSLQMAQDEKMSRADYVIRNSGSPEELFDTVENYYSLIKKEFLTRKI